MTPKFRTGDRVSRRVDVFDKNSPLKFGTICARFAEQTQYGFYSELYAVIWDEKLGFIDWGFLPHGLDLEARNLRNGNMFPEEHWQKVVKHLDEIACTAYSHYRSIERLKLDIMRIHHVTVDGTRWSEAQQKIAEEAMR